jgi:DNA-binding response OmpR family regulator
LLVVDDDEEIVQLLTRYLNGHGFQVFAAGSAAQSRAVMGAESIDLVLLDLGLPDEDGLSLLKDLQSIWNVSVIVVTGRGDAVERIVGLELGADDYVTKPFDFRELVARIRTVLRRARTTPETAPPKSQVLTFDRLKLDLSARQLSDREGRDIPLTTGEFDLLQVLLKSRPADEPHTWSRCGTFRPRHRCPDRTAAAQARDGPQRTPIDQIRTRRWLSVRGGRSQALTWTEYSPTSSMPFRMPWSSSTSMAVSSWLIARLNICLAICPPNWQAWRSKP